MFLFVLCLIPVYARFLEVDPAREFVNSYSYTGNNPVNLIDPTGKHVIVSRQKRDAQKDLVTIHMQAILIDNTGQDANTRIFTQAQLEGFRDRIVEQFQKTYTGTGKTIDYKGILELNIVPAEYVSRTADHLFILVNPQSIKDEKGRYSLGVAGLGGVRIFIDSSIAHLKPTTEGSFAGSGFGENGAPSLERTSVHEAGHSMSLDHPSDMDLGNIMHQSVVPSGGDKVLEKQILQIEQAFEKNLLNQQDY